MGVRDSSAGASGRGGAAGVERPGRGVRLRRSSAAVVAASALLVGAAPVAGAAPAAATGTADAAAAVGDVAPVAWGPCSVEESPVEEWPEEESPEQELVAPALDCATYAVPLDHDEPDGPTVDLALSRRPASDPGRRIGTLFVNPGGPGGSGVDLVPIADLLYQPEVLERFDVVGFDPRGVARSTPLTCLPDLGAYLDAFAEVPAFPLTAREEVVTTRAHREYTSSCAQDRQPLLDAMSTANAARDMDVLRAAVGDEALTYAGYSYGSQLGTTYANLFPDRVRALVVDGVLDPVAWTTGATPREARSQPFSTRLGSARGASDTLGAFAAECSAAGPQVCQLADGDPLARYAAVAEALREQPLELVIDDPELDEPFAVVLTYQDFVGATLGALYDAAAWPQLDVLVVEVESLLQVDAEAPAPSSSAAGAPVVAPAERVAAARAGAAWQALLAQAPGLDEDPAPEEPGDEPWDEGPVQVLEGFDGVACLDSDDPVRQRAWSSAGAAADREAPYFGRLWTWASIACATWPGEDEDRYVGPWDAQTSSPVLVVGNRFDPATPYAGAVAVAELLPSSRLLTLEGWGHTSIGLSECVDDAVTEYLVDGVVPEEGATCRSDRRPFDVVEEEVEALDAGAASAARDQVLEEALRPVTGAR